MLFSVALFQPDIAGNTGTILRLSACLGFKVHIIEPTGFSLSDQKLKRAAMDYLAYSCIERHIDWESFYQYTRQEHKRLIGFSTKASQIYHRFSFAKDDILLFGRESAGLPADIFPKLDASLTIAMRPNLRSLNLAMSVAMAAGEVTRQLSL